MESNIIARLLEFIKTSYSVRLKESVSGLLMGGCGGYSVYFGNIPPALIHTWVGVWLWIKTLFFAFTTSLVTAYGALLVEKYKERQKKSPGQKRKRNKAA